ncbi:MAG TPA: transglutaminase family protein [Euzebya sp.]|nr:transglutaminase family protein [Euzebya sp.]
MTYQVVHTTAYTYESEVSASYGQAHLLPRETPGQQVLSAVLQIDPAPDDLAERVDWFGNRTSFFAIASGHTSLTVTATSHVEVRGRGLGGRLLADQSWEAVVASMAEPGGPTHGLDRADGVTVTEYALDSPQAPRSPAAAAYAMPSFLPGRSILEAVEDLSRRIHRDFDFRPGTTAVGTPVTQVLTRRVGVCQDFAHLTVAALRSMGLAARYVSGYLETRPPPGQAKLQGADVSHAWASVYVPHVGWVDIDPTNNQFVGDRYITTAWGRDYGDVAPLKGIIFTDGDTERLRVSVDVRRVDTTALPSLRHQQAQQQQSQRHSGGGTGPMDL